MKKIVVAAVTLALLGAGAAQAQDSDRREDRRGGRGGERAEQRGDANQGAENRGAGNRGDGQRGGGDYNPAMRRSSRNTPDAPQAAPQAVAQPQQAPQAQAAPQPQQQRNWSEGRGDGNRGARAGDNTDSRRWDGDRNRNDAARQQAERAQAARQGDRNWQDGRNDRNWQGGNNNWRGDQRQAQRPRYDRRAYPSVYRFQQRVRGPAYRPPSGFYVRQWSYGNILPRGWYGTQYRLMDWWSYGLPIPPIGYDWVRVGDDALLVDSFTGRVVQVAYDLFW